MYEYKVKDVLGDPRFDTPDEVYMGGVLELNRFIEIMDKYEDPTYIEVGVKFGGTLFQILKYLETRNCGFVYGVDLYEDIALERENTKNGLQTHRIPDDYIVTATVDDLNKKLKAAGFNNFKLLKGYSHLVIPTIDDTFDFCFIDGNHTYKQCKLDFECCFDKSKVGTTFFFHNTCLVRERKPYRSEFPDGGPQKVCDELQNREDLEYLGTENCSSIFKRI